MVDFNPFDGDGLDRSGSTIAAVALAALAGRHGYKNLRVVGPNTLQQYFNPKVGPKGKDVVGKLTEGGDKIQKLFNVGGTAQRESADQAALNILNQIDYRTTEGLKASDEPAGQKFITENPFAPASGKTARRIPPQMQEWGELPEVTDRGVAAEFYQKVLQSESPSIRVWDPVKKTYSNKPAPLSIDVVDGVPTYRVYVRPKDQDPGDIFGSQGFTKEKSEFDNRWMGKITNQTYSRPETYSRPIGEEIPLGGQLDWEDKMPASADNLEVLLVPVKKKDVTKDSSGNVIADPWDNAMPYKQATKLEIHREKNKMQRYPNQTLLPTIPAPEKALEILEKLSRGELTPKERDNLIKGYLIDKNILDLDSPTLVKDAQKLREETLQHISQRDFSITNVQKTADYMRFLDNELKKIGPSASMLDIARARIRAQKKYNSSVKEFGKERGGLRTDSLIKVDRATEELVQDGTPLAGELQTAVGYLSPLLPTATRNLATTPKTISARAKKAFSNLTANSSPESSRRVFYDVSNNIIDRADAERKYGLDLVAHQNNPSKFAKPTPLPSIWDTVFSGTKRSPSFVGEVEVNGKKYQKKSVPQTIADFPLVPAKGTEYDKVNAAYVMLTGESYPTADVIRAAEKVELLKDELNAAIRGSSNPYVVQSLQAATAAAKSRLAYLPKKDLDDELTKEIANQTKILNAVKEQLTEPKALKVIDKEIAFLKSQLSKAERNKQRKYVKKTTGIYRGLSGIPNTVVADNPEIRRMTGRTMRKLFGNVGYEIPQEALRRAMNMDPNTRTTLLDKLRASLRLGQPDLFRRQMEYSRRNPGDAI